MDQPPVDNLTDFEVHPQMLLDKDGEKMAAIVKATFVMPPDGGPLEIAAEEERRVVRAADVPWGEPEKSSIAYPSDICLRKPGTDVVVVARAFAPRGEPAESWDVGVQVGRLRKALRVYGLRVWEDRGAGISPARPISDLEIRYDWAWGGSDAGEDGSIVEEPRNPVGLGVARDPAVLTHQRAPQIEDPAVPIRSCTTRPPPAGLGPIGRHWEPRRRYIGTYDAAWLELRNPLPPDDQDDRHNLCGSPGLVAETPLVGGEPVGLLALVPGGGATRFDLPRVAVEIEFRVKGREPARFRPYLDTVIIDTLDIGPDEPLAVELVWRAYVKPPRRLKDMTIVVREADA